MNRTIVRVTGINQEIVEAVIPGWNPHQTIRFPLVLIPVEIRKILRPNMRLFAHANIGADKPDDLCFKNFELAPELDENDGLA